MKQHVQIAVAPGKFARAFDGSNRDVVPTAYQVLELRDALERVYATDAHCVAYVVSGATEQFRIRKSAVNQVGSEVQAQVLMAQVSVRHHGCLTEQVTRDALDLVESLDVLRQAGIYFTPIGYCIVQPIDRPLPVASFEEHLAAWLVRLERAGVPVDTTYPDWTRHFRMPYARLSPAAPRPRVQLDRMEPVPVAEAAPLDDARPEPVNAPVALALRAPTDWVPRLNAIGAALPRDLERSSKLWWSLAGALLDGGLGPAHVPVACLEIASAAGLMVQRASLLAAAYEVLARAQAGEPFPRMHALRVRYPAIAAILEQACVVAGDAPTRVDQTLIRCSRANQQRWLTNEHLLATLAMVSRWVSAVPDERPIIVVARRAVCDGLARLLATRSRDSNANANRIRQMLSRWDRELRLVPYDALDDLDAVDAGALVTLGDPEDPEDLARAHARTLGLRALHVGGLVPRGWAADQIHFRSIPSGRPRVRG